MANAFRFRPSLEKEGVNGLKARVYLRVNLAGNRVSGGGCSASFSAVNKTDSLRFSRCDCMMSSTSALKLVHGQCEKLPPEEYAYDSSLVSLGMILSTACDRIST